VRRLGLIELSGAILRRIFPGIVGAADEAASRLFAEVEELHHDHLVDDGADFARDFRALHL